MSYSGTVPSIIVFTKQELPDLVREYIQAIETEPTEKHCLCTWRIHDDDVEKPEGTRRKVRIDEHAQCRVHTKEGLLIGFFPWVAERSGQRPIPDVSKSNAFAMKTSHVNVLQLPPELSHLLDLEADATDVVPNDPPPYLTENDLACPACNKVHDPPYRFNCDPVPNGD